MRSEAGVVAPRVEQHFIAHEAIDVAYAGMGSELLCAGLSDRDEVYRISGRPVVTVSKERKPTTVNMGFDPSCELPTDMQSILDFNTKKPNSIATRLCCTLGPQSRSVEVLEQLLRVGMHIARLDFSWGTPEYHQQTLDNLRVRYQGGMQRSYPLLFLLSMSSAIPLLSSPAAFICTSIT
jgi:hypothetical protein